MFSKLFSLVIHTITHPSGVAASGLGAIGDDVNVLKAIERNCGQPAILPLPCSQRVRTITHLIVVCCSAWPCAALAEPLTLPSQMSACATLVNFESTAIGPLPNPVVIESLQFATPGSGLGVASVASFGANGGNVNGRTLLPRPTGTFTGTPYANITIVLPFPASEIGMGWFDPNFSGNRLEVYSANGTLLETVNVPTFPTGGCCAAFVGIRRPSVEIARVVCRVSASNDVYSIDNIRVLYGVTSPESITRCAGSSATFTVVAHNVGPFTYRWRKDGTPIDTIANPSAATANLILTNVGQSDVASYDCVVTNSCGGVTSNPATLSVCVADSNCDGFLDFTDFDDFVTAFESGDPASDFNGDGFIDFTDFDAFVAAFEAGC